MSAGFAGRWLVIQQFHPQIHPRGMKALSVSNKLDAFGGKSMSADLPGEGRLRPGPGVQRKRRHLPFCRSPRAGSGTCVSPNQQAVMACGLAPHGRGADVSRCWGAASCSRHCPSLAPRAAVCRPHSSAWAPGPEGVGEAAGLGGGPRTLLTPRAGLGGPVGPVLCAPHQARRRQTRGAHPSSAPSGTGGEAAYERDARQGRRQPFPASLMPPRWLG